jgi:membrane fusion protein (multidrug efflux system)
VGAVLILAASVLGWYWHTTWRWLESTDDAYTQADNTAIVPRVSGYISELLVTDNQRVKAGEVLLRVDPRDCGCRPSAIQYTRGRGEYPQSRCADLSAAGDDLTGARRRSFGGVGSHLRTAEYARYATLAKTGAGNVQRAHRLPPICAIRPPL